MKPNQSPKKDWKKLLCSDRKQRKSEFLFAFGFAQKSPEDFWQLLITFVKWQSPQLLLSLLKKFNVNRRERKSLTLIFSFHTLAFLHFTSSFEDLTKKLAAEWKREKNDTFPWVFCFNLFSEVRPWVTFHWLASRLFRWTGLSLPCVGAGLHLKLFLLKQCCKVCHEIP